MLKKDITFIYTDSAEKSMYKPIAEEALKRGYKVTLSDNIFSRCEIGFYCQHVNFPQFSRFSFIMLHDIIQQYSNWPDIWFMEPWNKYDIGILPSNQWLENWKNSSHWFYARPRKGIFKVGWPKADAVVNSLNNSSSKLISEYNIDINKKTVLYAPAWENDGKQDDFVKAMQKLDVNILIKQFPWNVNIFPEQVKNVNEMKQLHSSLENVTILPPETNIFNAIAISDVLVSEESSTMCEAVMMGIPAVSVSDWLIPDVKPSRFPKCDYDFVIMTKKDALTDCVKEIIENYAYYKNRAEEFSSQNFSNIGKSSKIIMDIVDDCVLNKPFRYDVITPNENKRLTPAKYFRHRYNIVVRSLLHNYAKRHPLINFLLQQARKIKRILLPKL